MSPSFELRPIVPEDESLLRRVFDSTREEEMAMVNWPDGQKRAFLDMQFDAQHRDYQANYPGASFDVILRGTEALGRLYVHRLADEIRIIDISLLPEHRDRGVGGEILRSILAEASERGRRVTIHVERHNRALRLYHRLGFAPIGEVGIYYLMEWSPSRAKDGVPSEGA